MSSLTSEITNYSYLQHVPHAEAAALLGAFLASREQRSSQQMYLDRHARSRTFRNPLLLLAITRILSGATLFRKALLKNFLASRQ